MFGIGAAFVGIWIFCFIKGRQLDRAKNISLEETP
jgi:hypothetical protein